MISILSVTIQRYVVLSADHLIFGFGGYLSLAEKGVKQKVIADNLGYNISAWLRLYRLWKLALLCMPLLSHVSYEA